MKRVVIVVYVIVILLTSCSFYEREVVGIMGYTDCRTDAVACCQWAEEQGIPYRIVLGETPDGRHAQCVVWMAGEYVGLHWWEGAVFDAGLDKMQPYGEVTLEQARARWYGNY